MHSQVCDDTWLFRRDLAEAIPQFGGYVKVAERLAWKHTPKVRRKPGFWADMNNVKAELDNLADEEGMPRGVIPTKARLQQLGRYDLTKAIERKGGFAFVRSLPLPSRHRTAHSQSRSLRMLGCR